MSKQFRLQTNKRTSLKERLLSPARSSHSEFWALRDISFYVEAGETIAIIGRNGSGKSTLLKLLSRIIYPTSGEIITNGRVAGLLELGAGFHPEFTGRENIYVNASILGFSKSEIDERIGDIIAFSEVEEFIDSPVRNYSSGMYMRLAFSIAITVEPDIFLIDEVLAVGDISFQKKCMQRLKQLKRSGMTIVLVSHAEDQVEQLCDRSLWLEHGSVYRDGNTSEVVSAYSTYMSDGANQ